MTSLKEKPPLHWLSYF